MNPGLIKGYLGNLPNELRCQGFEACLHVNDALLLDNLWLLLKLKRIDHINHFDSLMQLRSLSSHGPQTLTVSRESSHLVANTKPRTQSHEKNLNNCIHLCVLRTVQHVPSSMLRSTVGSNIFGRRGKRACDAAELEHEKRQRHPQCWHGTQTGRSTLKWV